MENENCLNIPGEVRERCGPSKDHFNCRLHAQLLHDSSLLSRLQRENEVEISSGGYK